LNFDIAAFRRAFPEFASLVVYPTEQIELWVGLATAMVSPNVWCSQWNLGVSLYVAHELTLASQNARSAKVGGSPGQQGGIASQKTVGSVTVQYDPQTSTEKDAGYWNLTTYGKQFFRLAMRFGTRPVQL
jgi:hypothetical protein